MDIQPLVIWCDRRFTESAMAELVAGVRPHELRLAGRAHTRDARSPAPEDGLDQADVAFGQPSPDIASRCERLRWIHITTAGYTRYDNEPFRHALRRRGATFTNSSGVFDDPCAQHVLAMMLADARRLGESWTSQVTGGGWRPARQRQYLLNGQRVLILGFGAIARRLVELLGPFSMSIAAFRRSIRGDESCPTVSTRADLQRLLARADHVVNTLPDSPETRAFVSETLIGLMKPSAVFYNVGRGATVDQPALIEALNGGRIAAAYLDVTSPEPLPSDHPLWRATNCWITPHTAGGHDGESLRIVRHFLANLQRFERGQPLRDQVFPQA